MLEGIKLVIFDFDGTLVDSLEAVIWAYKKAFQDSIGQEVSEEKIMSLFGPKVSKVIDGLIPKDIQNRSALVRKTKLRFDNLFASEGWKKIKLLPFARELVKNLRERRFKISIVTNADRLIVESVLKHQDLNQFFDAIIAADDRFKNKEDSIKFLMKKFGVSKKAAIYIADMVFDITVARNVGIKIISVPGWDTKEMLEENDPDFIIDSLKELIK